jgi:hypothetical protein
MATFTKVEYLYRDYGNWKFYGDFVLEGRFDLEEARQYLFDDLKFVPNEVGVPSLRPNKINEDDHWLHEILETSVIDEPLLSLMSCTEFTRRLKQANEVGWLMLCPWV